MDTLHYDDNVTPRLSQDSSKKVCTYGNNLIELCIATGLKIANGRIFGYTIGKFTCHKYNGSSLIDYVLADNMVLLQIRYLQVNDFIGDISDHCLVSFGLAVRLSSVASVLSGSYLPKRLKWQDGTEPLLRAALMNDSQMSVITQKELCDINETVNSVNELITRVASKFLVRTGHKKKRKNKTWYNRTCSTLRREVKKLSKRLAANPFNTLVREAFNTTKRRYKKQLKIARSEYRYKLTNAIENTGNSNPKVYWQLLEQLKRMDQYQDNETIPISGESWYNYYSDLLRKHAPSPMDDDVLKELHNIEKQVEFTPLSYRITEEEINKAINELKTGKAAGPDGIPAEIIKALSSELMPILIKLFNAILSQGIYPKAWGEGIITSIYKKGQRTDPANYRGITLSNSLAKVFGLVLRQRLTTFCEVENTIDERQSSHRFPATSHERQSSHRAAIEQPSQRFYVHICSSFVNASSSCRRIAFWLMFVLHCTRR